MAMKTENDSKRLALVIGNSLYGSFSDLKNSKNDAEDVAFKLESLGFNVDLNVDCTTRDVLQDVSDFTKRIHNRVTDIVFYYAGHGCSIQGENFVVPIDGLSPKDPSTASQTYIKIDWLIDRISNDRPQDVPIIFIVDCCRTEVANGQLIHGDPIKTTAALPNVFIMYSTANGHFANDGEEGRNGAFTERLLEYLDADMTIEEISKRIAKDLKGKQIHWISSSMDDHYHFRQPPMEQTKPFANAEKFKVPFRKNNLFIGRVDILEKMEQNLRHNKHSGQCLPLVLSGLGGMGKTQLMMQYHYTHHDEYKDVFWLSAEGTAAAMDICHLLAETLGVKIVENEKDDRDGMLADRIRERLETRKDRWLLMLDNVETISDVSRFIPNKGGDVIITTRDHVDKRWGSVIHVDKMSKDDALLLLVGPEKQSAPSKPAMEIIEELDCMPLAIDIVRAYIDRTGATLKSYLKMYKKKNAILLYNMKDANLDQYKNTIATVWDVSLEKIRDQNKLAELLLCNCAILQPDAIPVSLFERQAATLSLKASVESIHDAIGVLAQFSFVRRATRRDLDSITISNGEKDDDNDHDDYNSGNNTIIIHRLVQAVVRDICMERNSLQMVYDRVITAFGKEVVTGDCYDPQVQRSYALYLPHIREIARLADWRQMDAKSQTLLAKLISQTVRHYIEFGDGYQSLQDLANIAILISKESNGLVHPDTAESLYNLAELYFNQAKYKESEPLYQQVLAIREEVLGLDHPSTAQSLNGLANVYFSRGKRDQASPLYQRALAIREKALGPDHLETAQSLNSLADCYSDQGKKGEAEKLYQRALSIQEKASGPDHPETAKFLNNLANVYSDLGKYNKASPLYQQALEIRKKALGSDHPKTALSLNNLARLHYNQNKYGSAIELYEEALPIYKKAFGHDHPDVAMCLHNLALIHHSQFEYRKASQLLRKALAIREKMLGPDHPGTAQSLNSLASCCSDQDKNDMAEQLYQRALVIYEKTLGPDHPDMTTPLHNLAGLYSEQGKYDKAEELYQRSRTIKEKALGPDHPEMAIPLNNLAVFYFKQRKYDKAELLYQQTLAIRKKALGPNHPETARTLLNLTAICVFARTKGGIQWCWRKIIKT